MTQARDGSAPRQLAAIDLGSNSFHLLIVEYSEGYFKTLEKRGEKVQLADGMDHHGQLSEEAMERAMACLAMFARFIDGIAPEDIRIVGTNALRIASNSGEFLSRAQQFLQHDIEIISGREEARLIYLGAAHALADVHGRRLVADIGGGSTEMIIGERFTPLALESLEMGCVVYTDRFFADGRVTEKNFRQAEREARSELASIARNYRRLGWQDPIGTSGTIRATAEILEAHQQCSEGIITRKGLEWLKKRLIKSGQLEGLALDGLKPTRARVYPAGLAILRAIFDLLELESMRYAGGALREGVMYDLIGRNTPEDPRHESVKALVKRFDIDERQQLNVCQTADILFSSARSEWGLTELHRCYLQWAASLHEMGLSISHARFHRHGSYILENADLSGFSRPEQGLLAFLVRAHRRRYPTREARQLPERQALHFQRIAVLLRLAVMLNHSRDDEPFQDLSLTVKGETLILTLPEQDTLRLNDAEREAHYLQEAGITLEVAIRQTNPPA
ncbi:exopolyphosphatase [Larsenimonas rhizosphaerae]|uniref:exopolyphosphatase n=1 Tax=Larsenimonas rhizosphaerae TaxID=2944682 RepID=UPI0020345D79|nr:exopolyphosphatase [Larsenimonas rhizosphaerae]MCM2129680.1 exopolyphosphatase [Larsenimonas rhizosphaerae]